MSTVAGFDFSDIFDDVVDRAGGEQSTATDVIRVRRGMRLLLERWEAQGYNTWRIRTLTVRASGTSPEVRLPACVDDVLQVNSLRYENSESPMRRISAVEYAQLATKKSTGQPAQYWLDRAREAPVLHIYPIGPAPIIVTYVERPADYDRFGAGDIDVPGRWLEALILNLAMDLAKKRPPYDEALVSRLTREAAEAEILAQDADRDRSRYRYKIEKRRR